MNCETCSRPTNYLRLSLGILCGIFFLFLLSATEGWSQPHRLAALSSLLSTGRSLHPVWFRRSSTAVEASSSQKKKPSRETRQERFDRMLSRLSEFRKKHGHTLVSRNDDEELHRWAQSIRKNYIPPINSKNNKQQETGEKGLITNGHQPSARWTNAAITMEEDVALSSTNASSSLSRRHRRQLPKEKMLQLEEVDFAWDVQAEIWERRYQELVEFFNRHGHCSVPCRHPTLGVWVRNQRREYRSLERGEASTLTRDRLEKLHAVNFVFSKSHVESWEERYQELVQYFQEHGNSDVPENYVRNYSLGQWCRNQRTAYQRYQQGLPCGLTKEKIALLQDVKFSWNLRDKRWNEKLDRLERYYRKHGHVRINPQDQDNRDLMIWLTFQRYIYNLRKRVSKNKQQHNDKPPLLAAASSTGPLTDERIAALEERIPNFSWKVRPSAPGGPSREDWANLFQAMRDKGIRPGMRPKQHWFEGQDRFHRDVTVKNVWTEEDLLELWNQEDDDEDDDDKFLGF